MRIAMHALRELRVAGLALIEKPGSEPLPEVVGLLSGALLGTIGWLLLLGLTWLS